MINSENDKEFIRILHVDDDSSHLEFTKMFLERLDPGLKVVSIQSPLEALKRFDEEKFDCVIVNYLMPRMDGIELARRLRERSSTPIIIYTGQGTEEVASQAFATGVDDYIRKELDPNHYQVLARRIRTAVERHNAMELIRYLNRTLRVIHSVNQFISREKDHDKLLMGACELLVQTGSYYDAWVLLLQGDGRSTFTSNVELTDALERMVELTRCGEPPGCVRRALERSGAHAISLPDPACTGCPMADRYIDRSALICRLGYGGKVYGLLTVTAPLKMVGDYEKELFQEIAGDISFALYAIDLDEKRRRAELGVREAEEKFRGIIERSIDIIYIVDTKGRITFVSPSVEEILGYKSEEVLGKPLFDFVQESDRRRAMDAFAEALEGTIAQGFITEAICKDHGRVFVQILTSPLEVEGEIVGFQGFVRDITGIVNRQRRLEALHRNVLELSSARTTKEVADSTFRNIRGIVDINQGGFGVVEDGLLRFIHILGFENRVFELPLDGPGITVRAVKTGHTQLVNDTRVDEDYVKGLARGVIESLSELAVPVKIGDDVVGVINIESPELNAFTEEDQKLLEIFAEHVAVALSRVRRTQELESIIEEKTRDLIQAERLASAGRVASMMAHDLRGPLQTIRNAIYLLKRAPKETEAMIDTIDGAVRTMVTMLDDIRNLMQEKPLRMEVTDLPALVRKATETISTDASIELVLVIGEGLDSVVLDPIQIYRVLENLIDNAVEAMPQGGELNVSAEREDDRVIIRVRDTGVGIPEDEMPNLFKPFYSTKPRGLGLGLAFCKRAVEAHGGTIEVESEVEKGTTVTIMLPLEKRGLKK